VLAAACLVLVVTGVFATDAGPHPGGEDIRRLGEPYRSVVVHAVATGVFGVVFLLLLVHLERRRRRWPGLADSALALAALLAVQVAVGEVQYHSNLPWWLVLVHVSLAAAVWAGTVAFVTLLWRPPAPLVGPPDVHWADGGRAPHR